MCGPTCVGRDLDMNDASYDTLVEMRMPTSPYHRVWLHQYANNTGYNYFFYSEDNDVTVPYVHVGHLPAGQRPGVCKHRGVLTAPI